MSAELRMAVQRLAAPAEEQEAYLRQLGTAPSADELALEFSDGLMVEKKRLGDEVRTAAIHLDEFLAGMGGPNHSESWTVIALHDSLEWARVRELATEILRRADERQQS